MTPPTERLLTPSKITAWLDCAHFLTLRHQLEDGSLSFEKESFGAFARLLLDKGLKHESDCLGVYRRQGLDVFEVPAQNRKGGESFAGWVERVGSPFDQGHDVIYQMPFIHDGMRGIADFLIRVEDDGGRASYEPVDAKLARTAAKPGHVLQLCFYADALKAMTGVAPESLHLWLGSGRVESLRAADFRSYWNRLRSQLRTLLADDFEGDATVPEPCDHCGFCEFATVCEEDWRGEDSLIYVAGIRKPDRNLLEEFGIRTTEALAACDCAIESMRPERLAKLVSQADLQVQARATPDLAPPHRIVEPTADPTWGRGFELMPQPDAGDVFLDFEGHPFWRADRGLFFLFGFIVRNKVGAWDYEARWAHSEQEEADATQALIGYFVDRRKAHPDMHVYHYNHTERSSLERLSVEYGVGQAAMENLAETGLFVDLLLVARNAVQAGVEGYGLKHLERLTPYARGHDIDQGAGAVVEYEAFTGDGDPERLQRIADYNEDDVRATLALRDWLVEHRPAALEWRVAAFEIAEPDLDFDARIAALQSFGPESPQHLLGDLLGYWFRERRANLAPKLAKTVLETSELLDDRDAIAGLVCLGLVERTGAKGRPITPAMRFSWPAQTIDSAFHASRKPVVLYATPHEVTGDTTVLQVDEEGRELDLFWGTRCQELGVTPTAVVLDDWVWPRPKPEALALLADRMLGPDPVTEVSTALLHRDPPAFAPGHIPLDLDVSGAFSDEVEAMVRWAPHLDRSYMAVQGPPGTGKTYRGAHLVRSLIEAGQRVGITAMSHHAIDNLLEEIVRVFAGNSSVALSAVRRGEEPDTGPLDRVTYTSDNKRCGGTEFNLVAGTTWLFAGTDMRDSPVDVLIIDEAGQLALADAVAAASSARNLILLGDPLQLPQVSHASHPGGSGCSVLEHVLGEDRTIPSDRGVFLAETRRMHPDVCRFISKQIYEGRLTSHPDCARQTTEFGTGLRWLEAHHADRSTECVEEAAIVGAEIRRLLGTTWVNQHGADAPLTVSDFMVVSPYNDQVRLLRDHLDADERTRGVPVGTVDKFQGREAPVVFFTMTTSSAADMPRNSDFLFSRNRLNVAISRARCLAYLVCTEQLLNSRAKDVDGMRLISTLCAFVEHSKA